MAKWPYNTSRWQRLRSSKLSAVPLCEDCIKLGKMIPATNVDHILPISEGGDPWDMHNLQCLCHSCHSRKTAMEDGGFGHNKGKSVRPGCDAKGNPIDPRHWWNT